MLTTDSYTLPESASQAHSWLPSFGEVHERPPSEDATLLIMKSRNRDLLGKEIKAFKPYGHRSGSFTAEGYYVEGHVFDPQNPPELRDRVVANNPTGGMLWGIFRGVSEDKQAIVEVLGGHGGPIPKVESAYVTVPAAYPTEARSLPSFNATLEGVKQAHFNNREEAAELQIQWTLLRGAEESLEKDVIKDLIEGEFPFRRKCSWDVTYEVSVVVLRDYLGDAEREGLDEIASRGVDIMSLNHQKASTFITSITVENVVGNTEKDISFETNKHRIWAQLVAALGTRGRGETLDVTGGTAQEFSISNILPWKD